MKRIFFTITGTKHYFGHEFIEPKMTVKLVKEPDNDYDREAIKVEMEDTIARGGRHPDNFSRRTPCVRSAGRTADTRKPR